MKVEDSGQTHLLHHDPIYYPSDKLHIGHAYTTVVADAIARYKRQTGYDVMFPTGSDEHGQNPADCRGKRHPERYVDRVAFGLEDFTLPVMILSGPQKSATPGVSRRSSSNSMTGDIYKSEYEGWYCVPVKPSGPSGSGEGIPGPTAAALWNWSGRELFLRLQVQDRWLNLLREPDFIQPASRRNEMISFVKSGLGSLLPHNL